MHYSWAMDLDPKGANSQIKDVLDPTLNRATQEDAAAAAAGGGVGPDGEIVDDVGGVEGDDGAAAGIEDSVTRVSDKPHVFGAFDHQRRCVLGNERKSGSALGIHVR